MKLKTIVAATLLGVSSFAANAFTITSGSYKMIVDSYTNGTVYTGSGTPLCTTAAGCDAAALIPATGGVGSEDTWGILSISSITNTSTNTQMFTRGPDGYLIGYVTGLTDNRVDDFGAFQLEYASGGVLSLFSSGVNYDPSINSANRAAVLAQFAALGPAYLQMAFVLGVDPSADGLVNSYSGNFNALTGAAGGSGFLEVTGGTAATTFDSNYFTTHAGLSADAYFTVTGKRPLSGDLGTVGGWLLNDSLDVQGQTVPEPGSMALAGLGLVGLAALRRRKQS